jgi:molecular chaperone Hsp33
VHGVTTMLAAAAGTIARDDIILPFQVDPFGLRGRLVRIGPALDAILHRHDYPPTVATTLAEMIAMAAGLAGALKFDGVFTLQVNGAGPVRLMVADMTSAGALRGYAQYDAARVAALGDAPSVPRLFGAGYLAFTVDQGAHTERYQGIVELTGGTLADCAHNYFRQSEQFQAGVKLAAGMTTGADGASRWRAGAVMIQRLPPADAQGSSEGRGLALPPERVEAEEEGWRRALTLMASATAAELVDPVLLPWRLVDRLFLAEGVRIYRPHDLYHACRCSRERVVTVLRSIPRDEIESLKIDGEIVVTCEFCNGRHVFGEADLVRLHAT